MDAGGGGGGWYEYTEDEGSVDDFEQARRTLANIILGTNPPSKFIGTMTGFSK